uniref:Uncharacterized protein n=1 Tax=Anguilla anguilla TaxID=7936 RepID=A0A0E9R0Z1_ANGAN
MYTHSQYNHMSRVRSEPVPGLNIITNLLLLGPRSTLLCFPFKSSSQVKH